MPPWMSLLLLLPLPCLAYKPPDPFPSCLIANITYEQTDILDVLTDCRTPEICQESCAALEDCRAVTWISDQSSLLPLGCLLFSQLGLNMMNTLMMMNLMMKTLMMMMIPGPELPCLNCVSGPPTCSCSIEGECKTGPNTVIDVHHDIPSEPDCRTICGETEGCVAYTFFGPSNPLSNLCILFNDCTEVIEDCLDCLTGFLPCNTCDFGDTVNDQCGEKFFSLIKFISIQFLTAASILDGQCSVPIATS